MKILSKNEIEQVSGGLTFQLHYTLDYGVIGGSILGGGVLILSFIMNIAGSHHKTAWSFVSQVTDDAVWMGIGGAIIGGVCVGFPRDLYHHFSGAGTPETT